MKSAGIKNRERSKPDAAWFKQQLENADISMRQAATKLGMDASQLSRSINGHRRFEYKEAEALATLIKSTASEVMFRAGQANVLSGELKTIVVRYEVNPQGEVTPAPDSVLSVPVPPGAPRDTKAAVCRASSGPFSMCNRWVFLYSSRAIKDGVGAALIGHLAVVRAEGDDHSKVRYVERGDRAGTFNLHDFSGSLLEKAVALVEGGLVSWTHILQ